jgi:transposase-like protein
MTSIPGNVIHVNGRQALQAELQQAREALRQRILVWFMVWFSEAAEVLLGRRNYERRTHVSRWQIQAARCPRCGTQRSRHFSRNGSRSRTLSFLDMVITVPLPRFICECGGSVRLDFGLLRPYQRIYDDVDAQLKRWAGLGLSLRQMQRELHHFHIGPLGLRTMITRLHQLRELTPTPDALPVPPILQVDAIWFTQLRPNGRVRRDACGRQRLVKGRFKRPLLIALGLWPETGHQEVFAWQLGEDESAATWLTFLTHLEEQGIRGAQGLQLIIHDGGSGLCTALETVYFGAPQQRCLFHKLRNIAQALEWPEDWPPERRRKYHRTILKEFTAIWQADHLPLALQRYQRVVDKYAAGQPKAIACLQRCFSDTLTYYHIEQQHADWPRTCLRTTSQLERFNRHLRQRIRVAGAYHSDAGILAMIAQLADQYADSI